MWKIASSYDFPDERLVSTVKFIAEVGLAFRDSENVGPPRTFFQKIFETFSSKYQKKEDAMLLATGFASVSRIVNHCQIHCCNIKFCCS